MFNDIVADKKIKKALEIYTERWIENLTAQAELEDAYVFSSDFERKMNRLIRRQKKTYYQWINTVGKRVAVFVFAIFIAAIVTISSVKAFREPVVDFIIEVYEKISTIIFDTGIPSASTPTSIEEAYVPSYLPDGLTLTTKDYYGILFRCEYHDEHDNYLLFEQNIFYDQKNIDTEGALTEEIQINGINGIYFSNKGYQRIIWNDSGYSFHLTSTFEKDELIRIAESVSPE